VAVGYEKEGAHAYIRYNDVRIPRDHILGNPGEGFVVAQTRLGGGRIHHAMRTVGLIRKAFDMMCERALSRQTQGEVLADKQLVQAMIADSWIEIESFRLLVLRTAWKIDKLKDYKQVRADISAVKAAMPRVCHDVYMRAMQIHGSIGASTEMPFASGLLSSMTLGMADGPTEVHKITLARQVLRRYEGTDQMFPDYHLIRRREAAIERYGDLIELEVGND
jgi:acyl-CoA dehydrogenase